MRKAVTIKDIAEQLNLSRNTVAKALNGQYVPEKTRSRVLEKAKELNYKSLSSVGSAEARGRKMRILLLSGKPLNNMAYFVPIIKEIENGCFERNFELFQYTYNKSRSTFSDLGNHISKLNVNGIIAIECFDRDFNARLINFGKPVCFIDFATGAVSAKRNYDIIGVSNEKAIGDYVRYLHKKHGVQRFTFVGDRQHCLSFHERHMGMRKGILTFGGEHSSKEDILRSDESFDYGNPEALRVEILKLRYLPDCFICCNDFVARAVCEALAGLDIKIPQKAMVVGFDNTVDATAQQPALTSFSVAKECLGRETLRTLISRMEYGDIPSRTITVNTAIVLRESTQRL